MLIAFRFGNHRSFRDEQELSLLLPSSERSARTEIAAWSEGWRARLEPVAGIYGANASGKSNVVNAAIFMEEAVRNSYQRWEPGGGIPADPFLLGLEDGSKSSSYEMEIVSPDGVRYQYGFRLDVDRILEEWLYAYPTSRRQVLFERASGTAEEFHFGKHLPGRNRTIAELTRPNSLFVSAAASNKHELLGDLWQWFARRLRFVLPSNQESRHVFTLDMIEKSEWKEKVVALLRFADLGISDLEMVRPDSGGLAEDPMAALRASVMAVRRKLEWARGAAIDDVRQLRFRHASGGASHGVLIPFERESNGTRMWFSLMGPILQALNGGETLFVDELDASLHPHLSAEIVRMFQDPELNPKLAQLVFTTHDTTLLGNLLGEPVLRRGQVWFTEKDAEGASTLIPLSDFSPRKPENLERGYLQGRYGAVPFLDPALVAGIRPSEGEHERDDGTAAHRNDP
jgi:hypothetical protein